MVSPQRRRVIFLVETPFTQRDSERFGVREFRSRGFIPEAWNVGPVYLPNAQSQWVFPATSLKCRNISKLAELRTLVDSLKGSDSLITMVGIQPGQVRKYRDVHRTMRRSECLYGAVAAAPVVHATQLLASMTLQRRLRQLIHAGMRSSGKFALRLLKVYRQALRLRCLDFAWVATNVDLIDPILVNGKTRIQLVHSLDYDLVLQEGVTPPLGPGPPLLLDDMGPDHPDFNSLDEAQAGDLDTNEYFRRLCQVLSSLEDHLGTPIEVAAHPRAEPRSAEARFAGRKVYYGETAKRIRRSSLVILTGASTAVGMAVAWSKPIIMIQADGIHAFERARNEELISSLNLPIWQFDRFLRREDWQHISRDKYQAYMERFVMRTGTPERPFWTVVADSLSGPDWLR